jgi:arylsulfatase A-like enzyme
LLTYENYLYTDLAPYTKDQYLPPNFPQAVNDNLTIGYLASVSYIDGLVGNLLTHLQNLGLDKNTIVVLWGDNGYKLNDHGYWSKGSNSDLDIRVPLIVRVPGHTQAGSKIAGIVEAVDIYPTLAELAGLPPRSDLEGQSFVKLLDAPATQWKSAAFAQYARATTDGPMYGYTVRTARYRYTAWVTSGQRIFTRELYDHDTDPDELKNVATDAAYAAVVADLEAMRLAGGAPVRAEVRSRLGL